MKYYVKSEFVIKNKDLKNEVGVRWAQLDQNENGVTVQDKKKKRVLLFLKNSSN